MRTQGQPGHHTQAAATAALDTPEQIGIFIGVGDEHLAIGSDDLRLDQPRRRGAEVFRETAETAALHQTSHAHRRATTALHIATATRGHRIVGIDPHRAGFDRHCRLRRLSARPSLRDKSIVQGDRTHVPHPYQQRIGRFGGALITMATTLHHQPQMMLTGEIDCCHDIGRILGSHCIRAGLGYPCIGPAAGLGQRGLIADVIRILDLLQRFTARGIRWRGRTAGKWRHRLQQPTAGRALQFIPLGR